MAAGHYFGIIVMFKVFKLLLEIAERYVILAMLTITAPLAFAMGGSKSTSEISQAGAGCSAVCAF